jgi:hypothetical protein
MNYAGLGLEPLNRAIPKVLSSLCSLLRGESVGRCPLLASAVAQVLTGEATKRLDGTYASLLSGDQAASELPLDSWPRSETDFRRIAIASTS